MNVGDICNREVVFVNRDVTVHAACRLMRHYHVGSLVVVVASVAMFCIVTFRSVIAAASFVMAFYVLARSLGAIRLIGGTALLDELAPARGVMTWMADAMAFVLPALDTFTRSEWLIAPGTLPAPLGHLALSATIYSVLLHCAALFDFYRREF